MIPATDYAVWEDESWAQTARHVQLAREAGALSRLARPPPATVRQPLSGRSLADGAAEWRPLAGADAVDADRAGCPVRLAAEIEVVFQPPEVREHVVPGPSRLAARAGRSFP